MQLPHSRHAQRRQQDADRRVRDQRLERPACSSRNPAAAQEVSVELGNGIGRSARQRRLRQLHSEDRASNALRFTFIGNYTGSGMQSAPNLTDDLISRGSDGTGTAGDQEGLGRERIGRRADRQGQAVVLHGEPIVGQRGNGRQRLLHADRGQAVSHEGRQCSSAT